LKGMIEDRRRMAMRYPVGTRSTGRKPLGGVHHDEKRGTDFTGWLYARRHTRRDGGVTWTRDSNLQPMKRRDYAAA
jgi:hypothetical protein